MKSTIVRFFSALIVAAAVGTAAIGCDMPEEKKSLFQRATTTQSDSAKSSEGKTDSKADEKKEQKKPRAFSRVDRVEV